MAKKTPGQGPATNDNTNDSKDGAPAPTREEARAMFKENPGLWSVLTDEGVVTRDAC